MERSAPQTQDSKRVPTPINFSINKGYLLIIGVIISVVILAGVMFVMRPKDRGFNPPQFGQIEHQSQQYSSSLESSKNYLKQNGIDCSHENTNDTYNSLNVNPQNTNIIYVGIEGKGVYKSEDGGTSWKRKIKGITVYPYLTNKNEYCFPDLSWIYIDPNNTNRLLLIASDISTGYIDWPYGETGGIWESFDGGDNWKQMIGKEMNVASSGVIGVDPKNPNVIYYPVNPDLPTFSEAPIKESLNKKSSVYKTEDGGKTWAEMDLPMLPNLQVTRIFINPSNSNHILFFTQSHDHIYGENSITEVFLEKQHGVLESFDGGKNWISWANRFPTPYGAIFDGDVSLNNFNHMIVRSFLFGPKYPPERTRQKSFYSLDGGKTFFETSYYIWVPRFNPHDKEGNHLLGFAVENRVVVESKNGGKSWEKIGTPTEVSGSNVRISHFVWDPKNANTVYMSGDRGNVWKSVDRGKRWMNILNLEKLPK